MSEEVIAPVAESDPGTPPAVETPVTPEVASPAEAKADAGTIVESNPEGVEPPAKTWPDDWREQLAAGDDKLLSRLKRFASPANVIKSWRELEGKLSSGQIKRVLPDDATPEDIAAYKKEHSLPEKPEDYKFDLDGFVPSEADKPILSEFQKFAHQNNWSPAQANAAVRFHYEQQQIAIERQTQNDRQFRMESTDDLRNEWGPDYRANVNAMQSFLKATAEEGFAERLFGARLGDGRVFGDDPAALRWLTSLSRNWFENSGLTPSGSPAEHGKSITTRKAEIRNIYQTDMERYYRDKLDLEMSRLIEAEEKMKSRAA